MAAPTSKSYRRFVSLSVLTLVLEGLNTKDWQIWVSAILINVPADVPGHRALIPSNRKSCKLIHSFLRQILYLLYNIDIVVLAARSYYFYRPGRKLKWIFRYMRVLGSHKSTGTLRILLPLGFYLEEHKSPTHEHWYAFTRTLTQ